MINTENRPDLLNVQNCTPTGFLENKMYAKKVSKYYLKKVYLQQTNVFNQIYFNSTPFNIRLYKTAT